MSKLFHYNQFMWKTVVLSSIILSWTCSLPLSTVFMICNDDFLFYSGPATHHRSVRGSQRWTQPHLAAGGALWRDTGKVMLMWDQIFHPQLYSKPTSKHQFEILLKRLSLITWICSLTISPPPPPPPPSCVFFCFIDLVDYVWLKFPLQSASDWIVLQFNTLIVVSLRFVLHASVVDIWHLDLYEQWT